MNEAISHLYQPIWRIIDQTSLGPQFGALQSFGMDDALCASIGSGYSCATARAWVHHQTIVLGIQDTKLPYLRAGLEFLDKQGYSYMVRNSGGLAVVLDEGVLNLTLVFPENNLNIKHGYEAMWRLIQQMFHDYPIKINAYEIQGSYCPGSYDLSIEGKKFAGISQRRIQNAVAVQCYLCVQGSGRKRASIIKEFYLHASKGVQTKSTPPKINPEVMASLTDLLGMELSIKDVMVRFFQAINDNCQESYASSLTDHEQHLYSHYYDRVVQRNQNMLEK